jgi:hypothetical protein
VTSGLHFDNTYAWVTSWDKNGMILQVRAYLDSALVAKAITENENTTNATYTTIRDVVYAGPGEIPDISAILS